MTANGGSDWSGLVCDILDQITIRLPLPDLIRFNSVCSSWKSISENVVCRINRMPWLIVPFHVNHACPFEKHHNYCRDGVLGFFSILDGVTYKVEIPELYERRICGSSNGWLVTIHGNSEMQLLHPFTRKVLKLPPFTEFPFVHSHISSPEEHYALSGVTSKMSYSGWHESSDQIRDTHIYKAIISNEPVSSMCHPVVVCISSRLTNLYFCMEGEETWRTIDCQHNSYSDVAFFKGDLYALRGSGEVDIVTLSVATASLFASADRNISNSYKTNSYLVPSGTALFQVVRFYSDWTVENNENKYRFTEKFMIYKLDCSARKWVEVKNLEDELLFLGSNESFSVFASDFPGFRKNCIYFSDEDMHKRFRGHDKGIYCLDDGSINKICAIDSKYICPRPLWYSAIP